MAKRGKRNQCEHDNAAITVQGCSTCVVTALQGLNLFRMYQVTPLELVEVLQRAFPNKEAWTIAREAAQKAVQSREPKGPFEPTPETRQ